MPLILGTNSIKDTGYDVANSLRFNSGSSDYLNKTFGTPTNEYKWTFSTWVKRSNLGAGQIFVPRTDGNNTGVIGFNSSNALDIYDYRNAYNMRYITNRLFRDVSAWYHIVVSSDSTLSTPLTNIYINGVQETSFSTSNAFTQNQANTFNRASVPHYVGQAGNGSQHFNGYMAETVFIDGQALDQTSFGEFDSDSPTIWKPKDVSGLTFGNNGFYLDFENSGALGADVSGNSNNFTVNNLTAVDQSLDTCTNNNAVGNNLIPSPATYSNGNLTVTNSGSWGTGGSTIAVTQGKWYAEMKVDSIAYVSFGVEDMDLVNVWSVSFIGASVNGRGYYNDGTSYNNLSASSFGSSYGAGDIIGIYLDMDNKFVYFSKNGVMQNSGDPSSGSSGTGGLSLAGTTYCFAYSVYSSTVSLNFGSPPFAITSGNADANGYGNFEYAVSSGYYSLNSKNLAEFG